MQPEDPLRTIWRRFRLGGELRPLVCLAVTVATALVLGGLGVAGGWLRGMFRENPNEQSFRIGNVRDGDIYTGLVVAGLVWLLVLIWVWRPAVRLDRHSLDSERRRQWGRPIAITVFIAAGVTVLSYLVGRRPWDDTSYLTTALSLVAAGIALVFWLPTIFHLEHGRPVVGPGGRINVHCPECGYSLVGLRQTTCPECGWSETIDGIIRAQGYAVDHRRGSSEANADADRAAEPPSEAEATPPPAP